MPKASGQTGKLIYGFRETRSSPSPAACLHYEQSGGPSRGGDLRTTYMELQPPWLVIPQCGRH